jgi:ubiquinone/menaquinone biosynthesis C-methylase UbiE
MTHPSSKHLPVKNQHNWKGYNMKNIKYEEIQRTYSSWSRFYEQVTPIYLLGNEGRLRREAIHALKLRPGQAVLDVGCGTGRNFPYIIQKIGEGGTLVGVDYTPAMLAKAHERVTKKGWKNVFLFQGDAARLDVDRNFDAALSTLAMSVIPDYKMALRRLVNHLSPGGRIAIADARRSQRSYARPFNFLADLLGWGAAADLSRPIWEEIEKLVGDYTYREWFMGFFYLVAGQSTG